MSIGSRKHGQNHYGYKNHLKCNARTKLIEDYAVTAASVHESQVLEELLDESDGRLHGDSAYRSARITSMLRERGIQNRIHEKGYRGRPLTEQHLEANRKKSRVRARGEHIFGFQVYQMRANWIRTIGRKRAERGIGLGNLVYNFFRYLQLGGSMT